MKNKVFYLSLIAVAFLTSSCGMSYYASSVYDDGIYYRSNPMSRSAVMAANEQMRNYNREVDASYFTTDSLGNVVLAEGVTYEDLLHRFDSPTYDYSLDYGGWYGDPYYSGYNTYSYAYNSPYYSYWYSPARYRSYGWYSPWAYSSYWYDPWYYDYYDWYGYGWYSPWRYSSYWYSPWYYGYGWSGHNHHYHPYNPKDKGHYGYNPSSNYYGRRHGGAATSPGTISSRRSYTNGGSYIPSTSVTGGRRVSGTPVGGTRSNGSSYRTGGTRSTTSGGNASYSTGGRRSSGSSSS
ncbi:MAG: hypothetical protein J5699_05915, partial [Bacteroidales bacterium]|nr:hypothetical protein [Bacteroidales bacterium]